MDPRYLKLKQGLEQLTNPQLQAVVDQPDGGMCLDTYNYDETTGLF